MVEPCLFCGSQSIEFNIQSTFPTYAGECADCGAKGPVERQYADAITAWNNVRRVQAWKTRMWRWGKQIDLVRWYVLTSWDKVRMLWWRVLRLGGHDDE